MDNQFMLSAILLILLNNVRFQYCNSNYTLVDFIDSDPIDSIISSTLKQEIKNCYSCEEVKLNKRCLCERDCTKSTSSSLQTKIFQKNKILRGFINKFNTYNRLTCQKLLPFLKLNYTQQSYLMISSCPSTSTKEDRKNCIDDQNNSNEARMPVIGMPKGHRDMILYKNLYCARCNQVNHFKFADFKLACKKRKHFERNSSYLVSYEDCAYKVLDNSLGPLIKECSKVQNNCTAYINSDIGESVVKLSWSYIISFSTPNIKRSHISDACKKEEIFSLVDNKCKPFNCGIGYQYQAGTCTKKKNTLIPIDEKKINTNQANQSKLESILQCVSNKQLGFFAQVNQKVTLGQFQVKFDKYFKSKEISMYYTNKSDKIFKISGNINPVQYLKGLNKELREITKEFIITSHPEPITTQLYGFDPSRTFTNYKLCVSPISFNVNFTKNCSFLLFANGSKVMRSIHENLSILLSVSRSDNKERFVSYYCERYHLHSGCKQETINDSYVLHGNKTLSVAQVNGELRNLLPDMYQPTLNGFSFCAFHQQRSNPENFSLYSWQETMNEVEQHVTLIGAVFNIFCYFVIFLTLALFNEIRNAGMVNLFGMIFFLFITDVLVVSLWRDTISPTVCKWIAILLHWSLLTVAMWGLIIAVDLILQFTRKTRLVINNQNYTRFFIQRVGYSLILPTLLVTVTAWLDHTGHIPMRYGLTERTCWISNRNLILVTYALPTCLVYIVSIICIATVLKTIGKEHKETKRTLKQSDRENIKFAKIGIKLIAILGLYELIGYIQVPHPDTENKLIFNASFSFIFVLLRGFKGFIIFCLYFMNKRTFQMYKTTYS